MVLTSQTAPDEEQLQKIVDVTYIFCQVHKPLFSLQGPSRDQYEQSARRGLNCLMWLVNKPDRLVWLKTVRPLLTVSDFTALFKEAWADVELPTCSGVHPATIIKWFREADKRIMMNSDEYAVYSELPAEVTAYRGCLLYKLDNGLSWTLSQKTADFFYERSCRMVQEHIPAVLCKAVIPKEHVLAYFNGRGEDELIADARYIWKSHEQAVNGKAGSEVTFLKKHD